MADKQELQEKVGYFAKSVSRYSRAKKLVWGCGIGLWVLACIISLIVFDIQYNASRNSSGDKGAEALGLFFGGIAMLRYGSYIAISALGVVILVACITTCIINNKKCQKMAAFIKEMEAGGYSKEEIRRSLLKDFSEKEVEKCLNQVFNNDRL